MNLLSPTTYYSKDDHQLYHYWPKANNDIELVESSLEYRLLGDNGSSLSLFYWHFVEILWLIIFLSFYRMPAGICDRMMEDNSHSKFLQNCQ